VLSGLLEITSVGRGSYPSSGMERNSPAANPRTRPFGPTRFPGGGKFFRTGANLADASTSSFAQRNVTPKKYALPYPPALSKLAPLRQRSGELQPDTVALPFAFWLGGRKRLTSAAPFFFFFFKIVAGPQAPSKFSASSLRRPTLRVLEGVSLFSAACWKGPGRERSKSPSAGCIVCRPALSAR